MTTSENYNNRIRIYYTLTDKGQSVVIEKMKELNEFIESLKLVIESKPGLSHA